MMYKDLETSGIIEDYQESARNWGTCWVHAKIVGRDSLSSIELGLILTNYCSARKWAIEYVQGSYEME